MARDKAYREAEMKIEQTQRGGATQLNLSDMKLTELPESLGQRGGLVCLNSAARFDKWNRAAVRKVTARPSRCK